VGCRIYLTLGSAQDIEPAGALVTGELVLLVVGEFEEANGAEVVDVAGAEVLVGDEVLDATGAEVLTGAKVLTGAAVVGSVVQSTLAGQSQ